MAIAPYRFEQHDTLSQLCQGMIFFTLLCAVILKAGDESVRDGPMGVILLVMMAVS